MAVGRDRLERGETERGGVSEDEGERKYDVHDEKDMKVLEKKVQSLSI